MNQSIKDALKRVLPTLVVAIVALVAVSLFRVGGGQIEGVADMNDTCIVTVEKYENLHYEDRVTYTLTGDQIYQLRAMILQSAFSKAGGTVTFEDQDMYDIQVVFPETQQVLQIHCIGNEYISVTDQFDGKHLKIDNPDWKTELETILALCAR